MTNPVNINERAIGVNFTANNEAEVLLWAPKAKNVSLKINNKKEFQLYSKGCGHWSVTTSELKGGDLYSFVIDGEELPDPASLSQPLGVHGPSQAVDLNEFSWTDHQWKNPSFEEYIIYELHVGTFSPAGTFKGVEEKLPYLKSLGITAIEIMPVAQFPGERNWGYDGVFPFAVQNSYGGAEGLQHLINECHRQGIAVILDVVYNHFGPEGNYFNNFGHYFTEKHKTPWGAAINFDDAWCDPVRQFFVENTLMWFRDFHVDALRYDAVHAIQDLSAVHIMKEIRQYVQQLINQTWCNHYMIAELDLNDPKYISPLEKGGYGMDAQWIDEFHHALRVSAGQDRTGYYEDFDGVRHLCKSYQDAYVYDGLYSHHRHRRFGMKADTQEGKQFIVFSQNHDQVGNRMLGERSCHLVSFEMTKLLAASTLVSPYVPLLFMGEEYGETNPFQFFTSHSDKELIENVRKGRKSEFAAFHIKGEPVDPQSDQAFIHSKLQWDLLYEGQHHQLLSFYRALIELRKSDPALKRLNRKLCLVECNEREQTLQLHRWHHDHHVLCLSNFSNEAKMIPVIPEQHWSMVLNTASHLWGGVEASSHELPDLDNTIRVAPESMLILSSTYV
jgi:maltooligosyltrehalose trehalohydrolase